MEPNKNWIQYTLIHTLSSPSPLSLSIHTKAKQKLYAEKREEEKIYKSND